MDFLSQMALLVHEESPLPEVTRGSVDHSRNGSVLHGPWLGEDCSAVLRAWLDAGLLSLATLVPGSPVAIDIGRAEARDLLSNPERWDSFSTLLIPTDRGIAQDLAEWILVAPARP
jgi:hypothetical protein